MGYTHDRNGMTIRVSVLLPQPYCLCGRLAPTNVNVRYAECQQKVNNEVKTTPLHSVLSQYNLVNVFINSFSTINTSIIHYQLQPSRSYLFIALLSSFHMNLSSEPPHPHKHTHTKGHSINVKKYKIPVVHYILKLLLGYFLCFTSSKYSKFPVIWHVWGMRCAGYMNLPTAQLLEKSNIKSKQHVSAFVLVWKPS
jgi:hypothetical protein